MAPRATLLVSRRFCPKLWEFLVTQNIVYARWDLTHMRSDWTSENSEKKFNLWMWNGSWVESHDPG